VVIPAPNVVRTIQELRLPRRPVRPVTREYQWAPSGNVDAIPTLTIVMKDGTVRLALSICVQDGKLTFVTTERTGEEVGLQAVNLEATRRANRR